MPTDTDKKQFIRIRGANENNLKNLSVDIPRDKFVVLTGLSGSGKSSLAFDTIYAEGQRRYMESLSSYARQFLGQMEKPDVESIEGLPPAISIDQKSTNRNPRSTVGTVTEIYDYFRLLYARVGIPHCPKCGREISKQTVDQMVDQIMGLPERTKIQLLAPVVRGRKGTHAKLLEHTKKSGCPSTAFSWMPPVTALCRRRFCRVQKSSAQSASRSVLPRSPESVSYRSSTGAASFWTAVWRRSPCALI